MDGVGGGFALLARVDVSMRETVVVWLLGATGGGGGAAFEVAGSRLAGW
jgi:hypothetical protein